MVDEAFSEYFRTGTFPPRPADITQIIATIRQRMQDDLPVHRGPSPEELEALRKDRESFFSSPEYKQFLERMKAKGM